MLALALVLGLLALVVSTLALRALLRLTRRFGTLAERVNASEEKARVRELLNRRPDCGSGMMLTWRLWRHQAAKGAGYTNGADPKARPVRHTS